MATTEQRLEVLGDYMQRLELQPMQVVEAMLQMVARDVPCSCVLRHYYRPETGNHESDCGRGPALADARKALRVLGRYNDARDDQRPPTRPTRRANAESLAAALQHMDDYRDELRRRR
jgi:hypothetical protein